MATPVIQSKVSTPWQHPGAGVSFTVPTGTAVGDLLVSLIFSVSTVGDTVDDPTTPAGWTRFLNGFYDGTSDTIKTFGFYKIATASEVSSIPTHATDNSGCGNCGILFRITGHYATAPITDQVYGNVTGTTNPTLTTSISTYTHDSLLFMGFCSILVSGSETASNYTINGTNPTWTEELDITAGTGVDKHAVVASAAEIAVRTVTTVECDVTTDGVDDGMAFFFVIAPQTNATGTNATFAVSPTLFSNAGVIVGGTGTNTLLSVSPNLPTQSGNVTTRTAWTNEADANTTWTNETL